MKHRGFAPITVLSLAAVACMMACANSEPIDIDAITAHRPASSGSGGSSLDPTGLGGTVGPGTGGSSGGNDMGAAGSAVTGTAGTGTQGQAGNGSGGSSSGSAGSIGSGTGGNGSGQGGSFGGSSFGGSSFGGSAGGRGGAAGTTTGFGGRGGSGGAVGRGGSGGSAGGATGRGGTTGTGGSSSPDAGADGGTTVTFTDIYNSILVAHCGGSQCHNPGSQKGISFSSQTNAYNAVKSRVTAGNGAGSSFYSTVNSGSMPPGGPKLSSTDLNKIKTWIDQGALNN
jgi:hypothetical protein